MGTPGDPGLGEARRAQRVGRGPVGGMAASQLQQDEGLPLQICWFVFKRSQIK